MGFYLWLAAQKLFFHINFYFVFMCAGVWMNFWQYLVMILFLLAEFECLLLIFLLPPAGSGGCQTQGALTFRLWMTWSRCGEWLSATVCMRETSPWLIMTVRHFYRFLWSHFGAFYSKSKGFVCPFSLSVLRLGLQHRSFPRRWDCDCQEPEGSRYQHPF